MRRRREQWEHRGLTVYRAAEFCGVSEATVRSWLHRNHLKRNKWKLIDPEELLKYLDERGTVGQRRSARQHGLN
jgi:helix-turn-helix protein